MTDSADQSIHYGQWPDSMDLGEMGIYYWEKMTIDGKDTYYLSAISQKDGQVYQSGTLSTAHGDGGVVTEYGYGYFYAANTGDPTLKSSGIGFTGSWGQDVQFTSYSLQNVDANNAMSDLLDGKYTFHSYNTWGTRTANQGLFTIQSGDAKDWSGEPPYGTWTLSRNGNSLTVQLNPFFANAMSCDSGREESGVLKALPGTKDNPYEVRSIDQLQFINWNTDNRNTNTVLVDANKAKFPYLSYYAKQKVQRAFYWTQSHDLTGNRQTYTPIAEFYGNDTNLSGWFGGTYDGQDYQIINVNIQGQMSSCAGLFGVVFDGVLKNVVLYSEDGTGFVRSYDDSEGKTDSSWYAIGGLAGLAASTNGNAIENCAVAGYTITDSHTGGGNWGGTGLGGLVGISNMKLYGCSAVTNIVLSSHDNDNVRVGGLVGASQGSVSSCYAGGSIKVEDAVVNESRGIYIGGISGGIYIKPLSVGSTQIGQSGQKLLRNSIENCYSYVELPGQDDMSVTLFWDSNSNSKQYGGGITALYAIGGNGDLRDFQKNGVGQLTGDTGETTYKNNYYLESVVMRNNPNGITTQDERGIIKAETDVYENDNVIAMTYAEMADTTSDAGLLEKLNAKIDQNNEKFATVTTETASGAPLAGRYSFGSDPSLLGKDYPFPTILTQSSDVAKNGIANVHYGDWPLEGIRRPDGALPVNLDLFADYEQDKEGAVKVEKLELSGVSPGGTWSASSDKESVVKAEVKGSGSNGILTITALGEGNTTVTVTYTLGNDVYSLTIEVNVTAQLRLAVASGVNTLVTVFPNATVSTPLALTDKDGHPLSADLKAGINLDSINVEFDPDYFTDAQVVQGTEGTTGQKPLTLTADSGAKAGPTQMTAAYQFTYLDKEYSATSVLSLQVVDAEITLTPVSFTFAPGDQEEKVQTYSAAEENFKIKVEGQEKTIGNPTITDFNFDTAFNQIIWVDWATDEEGNEILGTLSIEAYPQTYYPATASVRLQLSFTCDGSTHTMWQDLMVQLQQEGQEGVVTP